MKTKKISADAIIHKADALTFLTSKATKQTPNPEADYLDLRRSNDEKDFFISDGPFCHTRPFNGSQRPRPPFMLPLRSRLRLLLRPPGQPRPGMYTPILTDTPIRSNSHIITHAADVRFLSKNISGLTGYRSTGATFRRSAGSTAADSNPTFTPQVTESTDAEIPASVFLTSEPLFHCHQDLNQFFISNDVRDHRVKVL